MANNVKIPTLASKHQLILIHNFLELKVVYQCVIDINNAIVEKKNVETGSFWANSS